MRPVTVCDGLVGAPPAGFNLLESHARGYVATWNILLTSGIRELKHKLIKMPTVCITVTVPSKISLFDREHGGVMIDMLR